VTWLYGTLLFVAVQRLGELVWAGRNTGRLRRQGAVEADAAGYPFLVLLHAGWLAAMALFVPAAAAPRWPLLALFGALQLFRLWVVVSLGRFWTTRILTLPGAPLVEKGPYRWLRHPNYLVVAAEIASLPLAFGAVAVAAAFSVLNLVLIGRRIGIEERLLMPRRRLGRRRRARPRRPAAGPGSALPRWRSACSWRSSTSRSSPVRSPTSRPGSASGSTG
jgi:methyltransferase